MRSDETMTEWGRRRAWYDDQGVVFGVEYVAARRSPRRGRWRCVRMLVALFLAVNVSLLYLRELGTYVTEDASRAADIWSREGGC